MNSHMASPACEGTKDSHTLFHCASQRIFNQREVCGNTAPRKSVDALFPTAFGHFLCRSRVGKSRDISNLVIIIYQLWWSVIGNL